jgi:tetratricopeptide (TPR) repeat protein
MVRESVKSLRMRPLIVLAFLLSSTPVSLQALQLSDFVAGRGRNWDAIKILSQGDHEMRSGNYQAARRDFDTAIRADPTLWVAIFWRARLSALERKWDLVIQDCNAVLRQDSTFVEAAVLRAGADIPLGRYAASLRDLNDSILLHPARLETYALALNRRAWLRATCPDASIRNGRAAIDDSKKACNITKWKEADMIDTLAAASAEAGDFDSAMRYEQQAMSAPDANEMSGTLQEHLSMFKQHRPVRIK